MAAKLYNVRITIKEIMKGKCSQGYKVGDTWLIEKNVTPANMCGTSFAALYPALRTMRYGGELPWADNKDVVLIGCPDTSHVVVYELKRIPKE